MKKPTNIELVLLIICLGLAAYIYASQFMRQRSGAGIVFSIPIQLQENGTKYQGWIQLRQDKSCTWMIGGEAK